MWRLNQQQKSFLPFKKTQSHHNQTGNNFNIESNPQYPQNEESPFTLAQLAQRGDLDIEKENAAKQNVLKAFDFEDENMINDVMNTEKYLLNNMPHHQMSNIKPLSRLNYHNQGQQDLNNF